MIHKLGEWVGGTPNVLEWPVLAFFETGSPQAKVCLKMLQKKSQEAFEVAKLKSNIYARSAIDTYDEWWETLNDN